MPRVVPQAAAVPVRDGLICLVTSRRGKRWVIPKGMIDPGDTPAQSAVTEAWEEAGLTGEVSAEPVGRYDYEKWNTPHEVVVFLLAVLEEATDWPERGFRQRVWVTPAEAALRVDEPALKAILACLCEREA